MNQNLLSWLMVARVNGLKFRTEHFLREEFALSLLLKADFLPLTASSNKLTGLYNNHLIYYYNNCHLYCKMTCFSIVTEIYKATQSIFNSALSICTTALSCNKAFNQIGNIKH